MTNVWPRLFLLEARRTVAVWLLLPAVGLAWLLAWEGRPEDWLVWAQASVRVRDAALFTGPFIAGAAAWMAGRDRRRGITDLLATTPLPPWPRRLATWAGTTAWALVAYLAVGATIIGQTALQAVWGGPVLWPMLVGLLALPAHAALGFALGHLLPSRFTAPLVAIALFFAQALIGAGILYSVWSQPDPRLEWLTFLSPTARLDASVWHGVRPRVGPGQMLFLLGLTGLALAAIAPRERAGVAPWLAPLIASALALAGVALLIQATPRGGTNALRFADTRHLDGIQADVIPYEPVCSIDPLPVCVHPAYQPWLDSNAATVNRITTPLLGLPGAPVRAGQAITPYHHGISGGVLLFALTDRPEESSFFARAIAISLTQSDRSSRLTFGPGPPQRLCPGDNPARCAKAQYTIALWLLRQAGIESDPAEFVLVRSPQGDRADTEVVAAANHFAALDPTRQQEWLRAHYADLRAGKVRLEDLP